MTTVFLVGTFASALVAQLAAMAFFLQLGSRWVKIPNVSFFRALGAIVLAGIVSPIPGILLDCVPAGGLGRAIFVSVLEIVLALGLTWIVIARVLRTSTWRAIAAWLATLIPAVVFALLAILVVRPYLYEAFKITTNPMAPSVLGPHWQAPCPRCGSPAFCTPEPDRGAAYNEPVLMICSREFRSCKVDNPSHVEHGGDRIIVNKCIHPQRWDVIVFRCPVDPKINFCMRLAGLPGETVMIEDGAVWINGRRRMPPESCQGIEYLDHIEGWSRALWGSEAHPAKLGADEYFVLGDFSARAKDSRLWEHGAPGHPPYAVPASYVIGVATHVYWPPGRWRVLR